jgi:hypothetical protein
MGSAETLIKVAPKRRKSAGSKKDRQHSHNAEKYRQQKFKTTANKERTWKRHLLNNPKDLQAKKEIERIRLSIY